MVAADAAAPAPTGLDRTAVERAAAALARGGCRPVVVVTPRGAPGAAVIARRVGARLVEGGDAPVDAADAARRALPALPAGVSGLAILPPAHAAVAAVTVEELLAAFDADPTRTLVPTHGGRPGWPIVVPARRFAELLGGAALRDDDARVLPVDDPAVSGSRP